MEEIFITKIHINEVRHLKDLDIPLSETERKHLILTGKNGSGKTSVLSALQIFLDAIIEHQSNKVKGLHCTAWLTNQVSMFLPSIKTNGFVNVYFPAQRSLGLPEVGQPGMLPTERPKRNDQAINYFPQYISNLHVKRLFAKEDGNDLEVQKIDKWLNTLESSLSDLLELSEGELKYNRQNFRYEIQSKGKESRSLNELSAGYSSALHSTLEILMRMEPNKWESYDIQGIVLIDEIETHLHIDLQKKILPFLTKFFPRIQFIVTTHSPFVISSVDNAVICDLESGIITEDLSGYSYNALVESYFDADNYSHHLQKEVAEYEELLAKDQLTDEESRRLFELKHRLYSLPKFGAKELNIKLNQLKLKYPKGA